MVIKLNIVDDIDNVKNPGDAITVSGIHNKTGNRIIQLIICCPNVVVVVVLLVIIFIIKKLNYIHLL